MPADLISLIDVKAPEGFSTYMVLSIEIAVEYWVKLVLEAGFVGAINGTLPRHQQVVVAVFLDMASLESWKTSSAYQPLVPLRENSSTQVMTAYQAG